VPVNECPGSSRQCEGYDSFSGKEFSRHGDAAASHSLWDLPAHRRLSPWWGEWGAH